MSRDSWILEWPRLCAQISKFASTEGGKIFCKNIPIPNRIETSRLLLAQTLEIDKIDSLIEGGISFTGIHEIKLIIYRCYKKGIARGEELLLVADTLSAARRLRRQIYETDLRPKLSELLVNITTMPDLEKLIRFGIEEGGRVADRASQRLGDLRSKLHIKRLERKDYIQQLLRKYSQLLQDNVVGNRNGRTVLAFKAHAASSISGLIHDSSSSGNTVFIEPKEIISIGNCISEIESHIFEEEQYLLSEWSKKVGEQFLDLSHLSEVMLQLDFALARARYCSWIGSVPPIIVDDPDGEFTLEKFRHPHLVAQQLINQGQEVIPINIQINSNIKVVAITGPNTGGKTVTLKSIGLASIMVKVGLFLPCSGNPIIPWFNQVLADIGDEQSLQQSLSTFSGHIIRIGRILKSIDKNNGTALVLLDELGAGTDPSEGAALAIALLKTLSDKSSLTIATTHFGELKSLKYSDSRFENASVAFDSDTIKPKYRLQWGIPGRSNALAIANRLGLDNQVIEKAQQLISVNSGEEINSVISGLEDQRQRQQEAAEDAAALLARTELLHEELLHRWNSQCKRTELIREKNIEKMEKSILEGQKEVRRLIRKLRDQDANGETARIAGQRLQSLGKSLKPKVSKTINHEWKPEVGDRVRLRTLGKAGEVISVTENGLHLIVICGLFRSKVHLSEIESLDGRRASFDQSSIKVNCEKKYGNNSLIRTKKNTIDVRGCRVHEAEVILEEGLRRGTGPFWVVHGIGSGRLKNGLRKWLSELSYVDHIDDADPNDGGLGCSIIWLRS